MTLAEYGGIRLGAPGFRTRAVKFAWVMRIGFRGLPAGAWAKTAAAAQSASVAAETPWSNLYRPERIDSELWSCAIGGVLSTQAVHAPACFTIYSKAASGSQPHRTTTFASPAFPAAS